MLFKGDCWQRFIDFPNSLVERKFQASYWKYEVEYDYFINYYGKNGIKAKPENWCQAWNLNGHATTNNLVESFHGSIKKHNFVHGRMTLGSIHI